MLLSYGYNNLRAKYTLRWTIIHTIQTSGGGIRHTDLVFKVLPTRHCRVRPHYIDKIFDTYYNLIMYYNIIILNSEPRLVCLITFTLWCGWSWFVPTLHSCDVLYLRTDIALEGDWDSFYYLRLGLRYLVSRVGYILIILLTFYACDRRR